MRLFFSISILSIFLTSCGTNILISPFGCETEAVWERAIDDPDFVIEKTVWSPFGLFSQRVIKIKDQLKKDKIYCSQLGRLSVTTKSTWKDVFRSIIPFAATRTVVLAGSYKFRPDLHSMDGTIVNPPHDE